MASIYANLPYQHLLSHCMKASDALARFDERISRSPIRQGLLERLDFHDAASSLWNDGELVHIEDLVLHDARMDIRAPSQEIIGAHRILRARRLIVSNPATWALSPFGLSLLAGKEIKSDLSTQRAAPVETDDHFAAEDGLDAIDEAFNDLDRLLQRSSDVLERVHTPAIERPSDPKALFFDPDWNEDERLDAWIKLIEEHQHEPGILQAAIAFDAWEQIEVLQRSPWLGRQLACAVLRSSKVTNYHLCGINIGLKNLPKRQRQGLPIARRIELIIHAMESFAHFGLKEHDRLLQAKARMERISDGRRSNSRLPELISLVMAKPVVSTSMIVEELGLTPQGAVGLAKQLQLREMTGRGRFRAWGIV